MNKQDILVLYKYNQWANGKILDSTAFVTPEQFLAGASFPHDGLCGTLTHVLFAEWIWRSRWEGISPTVRFKTEDFPTFDSLKTRWLQEESFLMKFVDEITDERLNRPFQYKNTRGEPKESILWHAMMQVVNHGTQHRAEAAAMLTEYGCSPGDLDLIYFLEK